MTRRPDEIASLQREVGRSLALRRAAAGLTQANLADVTHYSRTSIAHIEAGRQFPDREFWSQADTAVGAEGQIVDRYDDVLSVMFEHEQRQLESRKRQATASLEIADSRLTGVRLAGGALEEMRAMSTAFQAADRRVGGGRLYGSVVGYLKTTVARNIFDADAGEARSSEMFSAAASLTEIAGWMAHDNGADDKARLHLDSAFRLASAASNSGLCANICASMSHLASQTSQAADAIRIADVGLRRVKDSDRLSSLRARLLTMRARGFAGNGGSNECLRSLEMATEELASAKATGSDWISGFDSGSLASEEASCLTLLGDFSRAEVAARRAVSLRPGDRVRSRSFAQLILAEALYRNGEIEESARHGVTVCLALNDLTSARVRGKLAHLIKLLRVHSIPEVHELSSLWMGFETGSAKSDYEWPV